MNLVCPECGSQDVRRVDHIVLLIVAAVFLAICVALDQQVLAICALVLAIVVVLLPDVRCTRCLYRWNPRRERPEPPEPGEPDTIEVACPHCGSIEVYDRGYPLLTQQCHTCGSKLP
ncbi:MAG TPA: hypothetical protein VLU46_06120 [Thermoanaerobaculia bacterium]|nr:hypothetical protein [Thermoanaerobaculia bacterium]